MPYQVLNLPNAYAISNPQLWVVEKRPEVTWMPWFAPGGSMGRAALAQGDMTAVYEEQIRALADRARELDSELLLDQVNVCNAQAALLRSAIQPQDVAAHTADVEKCISALRTKIEASTSAASAPKTGPAPSLARIPAAAWALGASAILGVIAYATTRR